MDDTRRRILQQAVLPKFRAGDVPGGVEAGTDAIIQQLGLDPAGLPPRDRQRYWYNAIAHAQVDSAKAIEDANHLAPALHKAGYDIGPAPRK